MINNMKKFDIDVDINGRGIRKVSKQCKSGNESKSRQKFRKIEREEIIWHTQKEYHQ